MFTSAVSIFSAGTSFSWVKDNLCEELATEAKATNQDVYSLMNHVAEQAPVGSNKLLFNPSLAGGTSQDASVHIRGAYIGLDLKHGKPELIRAAMEGIALNLRLRLDLLRKYTPSGKIQSNITALEAQDGEVKTNMQGWSNLTAGNVTLDFIQGGHWDAITERNYARYRTVIENVLTK